MGALEGLVFQGGVETFAGCVLRSVVAVEHGAVQADTGRGCHPQCVSDQAGAHELIDSESGSRDLRNLSAVDSMQDLGGLIGLDRSTWVRLLMGWQQGRTTKSAGSSGAATGVQ